MIAFIQHILWDIFYGFLAGIACLIGLVILCAVMDYRPKHRLPGGRGP